MAINSREIELALENKDKFQRIRDFIEEQFEVHSVLFLTYNELETETKMGFELIVQVPANHKNNWPKNLFDQLANMKKC